MPDKLIFPYGDDHRDALRRAISTDRFATYLREAAGDEDAALCLYAWNTAVASAFHGPLQMCEVALRNAINAQLVPTFGAEWFHNASILRGGEIRRASEAKDAVERSGKDVTPGRVIAELGFGYWVGMFANRYDTTIWRSHLHRAFYPRVKRADLFDMLDRLRTLRNRVAHHEHLLNRNLMEDYGRVTGLLDLLSPPLREWVDHHSRVYDLLALDYPDIERF